MPISKRLSGTVVCIGTGPSLTLQQIESARHKGYALTGCNNVWEIIPDLKVLYACNFGWWQHYMSPALMEYPAEKWTTNKDAAERFGVHWIAERNAMGLSQDPSVIHHGHGSGYSLVNLVYLLGAERILLLGYDLKYAKDYDGKTQKVGSSPRHYFGEYPQDIQHWPSKRVVSGVHVELLDLYRSVAAQGAVEIVNCTPDSAIDCFPRASIDAV